MPDRFHARYNAVSKTYVYTIHTGIVSDVFRRKYVYDYDKPLDTIPVCIVYTYVFDTALYLA